MSAHCAALPGSREKTSPENISERLPLFRVSHFPTRTHHMIIFDHFFLYTIILYSSAQCATCTASIINNSACVFVASVYWSFSPIWRVKSVCRIVTALGQLRFEKLRGLTSSHAYAHTNRPRLAIWFFFVVFSSFNISTHTPSQSNFFLNI